MTQSEYEGAQIEIDAAGEGSVTIDGNTIDVKRDEEANTFNTVELPYRTFSSLEDLAQAVIDQRNDS